MSDEKNSEYEVFSYNWIKNDLAEFTMDIKKTIDTEKRQHLLSYHPGFPLLLLGMLRVSWETWQCICFICSKDLVKKGGRIEFSVCVPPLARTLCDSIFSIVYLFDDPKQRLSDYFKSNWAQLSLHHADLLNRYGNQLDWKDWLEEHASQIDWFKRDIQFIPGEELNLKKFSKSWPNPGKMISSTSDSGRKEFLRFLNIWFYALLSQDAHLSGPGIIRRSGMFLHQPEDTKRKYQSDCVMTSLTLLLALLSELATDACASDALKTRASYLWGMLNPFWGQAKELWEIRYESLLSTNGL